MDDASNRQTYQRDYYAKHRGEILDRERARRPASRIRRRATFARNLVDLRAFKLLRGCIDCGYDVNADALELDHVRGQKKAHVSELLLCGKQLIAEVQKCEVRCANCHSIVSAARRRTAKAA